MPKSKTELRPVAEWTEIYVDLKKQIEKMEADSKIAAYKELLEEFEIAKEAVKNQVKENKESLELDGQVFQYQSAYKKWIDYDIASKLVGRQNQGKLDEITSFEANVDMKKFIEMCREGVFPENAHVGAYKEEEKSPRVVIVDSKES